MRIQFHEPGDGFMDPDEDDMERALMDESRPTRDGEGDALMRHGWEKYASDDYLNRLNSEFYMYYTEKRHETGAHPHDHDPDADQVPEWRMRQRLKTVSAALVVCLNLGVDPPDIIRTQPSARLEAWVDPCATTASAKAMEQIGRNLHAQYESLSIRTRYKQHLDPSVDETKKFCAALRRGAGEERILFHYNGHGVPRPTASGEIWVFNRTFTQYIPISLYDLQAWLGAPSLFVYDCADAGTVLLNFARFVDKHEAEQADRRAHDPAAPIIPWGDCIQLGACGVGEALPTHPDLPADLFTCCLTTPIDISLRIFAQQNPLPSPLPLDRVSRLPGRLQDRRSPMGELNWIFTAITDTIAWNCLPHALFKRLFRQDLMVAALFRNFLLAQRLMPAYGCHPQSHPALPSSTAHHPLWRSWDQACESVLGQLPALLREAEAPAPDGVGRATVDVYRHSSFFTEQLTAFEVYLTHGAPSRRPPDQLPIVLQVLMSQIHRLRALILLSKFLDLGPWAVHLALSIGIFTYVLRLLQSAAAELKPVMVFIWARLLAVDPSCQHDLLKDGGFQYFVQILDPHRPMPIPNVSEHRAMCAFILTVFCRGCPQAQQACMDPAVLSACLTHADDPGNPRLRQWACLCIAQLWADHPDAKWLGIREDAPRRLARLAADPTPEVRAAAVVACTTFLGLPDLTDRVAAIEAACAAALLPVAADASPAVRREWLVFASTMVRRYEAHVLVAAYERLLADRPDGHVNTLTALVPSGARFQRQPASMETPPSPSGSGGEHGLFPHNTVFAGLWARVLILSVDPHPEVATAGGIIVDFVHRALLLSPLSSVARKAMDDIIRAGERSAAASRPAPAETSPIMPRALPALNTEQSRPGSTEGAPAESGGGGGGGDLLSSIRRTASIATSLKNLAFGTSSHALSAARPSVDRSATTAGTAHTATPPSTAASMSGRGPRPIGPPRPQAPAEWSRPPHQDDPQSSISPLPPAKVPRPPRFQPRDSTTPLSLPLESKFLPFSTEVVFACYRPDVDMRGQLTHPQYFREPQMRPAEADEPGSNEYNERLWRRTRNDKIISTTQPQKDEAQYRRWDVPTALFSNGSQPMRMIFHQFENHLAVADDRDTICIWNWRKQIRLNRFSNANPAGSKVTEMRFINEDDQAFLMVGSSDGVIKVYKHYESESRVGLVTAWRALTDLVSSSFNAGLVFEWQQGQGKALVAGDIKVIRVWNAAHELCTASIPARSGSCITSLTSDLVAGNFFVAGFGDGAVRAYDQRIPPREAMVRAWKDHRQWITGVHLQRGGLRELTTGSRNGEVKLFDIRMEQAIRTIRTTENTLRTLSVHEHAPVFAA
ncbi:MAG: Negative regulator of mitotic exit [Watsoniomyces obsoletus]|nr:MAG: Negative regulator of mitotic exit [Watsoniomyces obsoletus]